MATQVIKTYVDDLDGSTDDVDEMKFSLDGKSYEIDLSKDNAERLYAALEPFIDAARRAGHQPARPAQPAGGRSREDLAEIRAWVRKHGGHVADKGRISKRLIEAYDANDVDWIRGEFAAAS